MSKISVVINTLNEASDLEQALESLKWADEIIVCDMYSDDNSVEIAKKYGAKVVFHKRVSHVELARNYAISKASNDWILILDPDEEIPESLASRIQDITVKMEQINFVEIPRKNLIFNKWMKASMLWPDYNIRFFRKGTVVWGEKIHLDPQTNGVGIKLEMEEKYAMIHHHYTSVSQFIERLNRYTTVQAKELHSDGVKFDWADLISKPLGEFLGRFFANKGFEDGLHCLSLSLLQAFSFLVVYLKLWELQKFRDTNIKLEDMKVLVKKSGGEINYWFKYGNLSQNPFKRFAQKVRNKVV